MKKILATGIIVLSLGAANAFASQTFSCGMPVVTTAQTGLTTQFKISCENVSGRTFNGFSLDPSQFNDTPATMTQVGLTSCTNFPDPNMGPGDICTTTFDFTPSQIDTYAYEFIATAGIGGQQYGVFCNNNPSGDCFSIATRPAFVVVGNVGDDMVRTYKFNPTQMGSISPAPTNTLGGGSSNIDSPNAITLDAEGFLWIANNDNGSANRFPFGSSGGPSPTQNIEGAATTLVEPSGIGTDADGNIYVADQLQNAISVFASGDTGNVAPMRRIFGPTTTLNAPQRMWVSPEGLIYVANGLNGSLLIFDVGADGDVAPITTIAGPNTQLIAPVGMWVDANGHIWTTDIINNIVFEFAADADGDVVPLRMISGGATTINGPQNVATDAAGYIYVTSTVNFQVNVYTPDAIGNVPPILTFTPGASGLIFPTGLALQ